MRTAIYRSEAMGWLEVHSSSSPLAIFRSVKLRPKEGAFLGAFYRRDCSAVQLHKIDCGVCVQYLDAELDGSDFSLVFLM